MAFDSPLPETTSPLCTPPSSDAEWCLIWRAAVGGEGREGGREGGRREEWENSPAGQIEIRIEHWEKEASAPYSLIPKKD